MEEEHRTGSNLTREELIALADTRPYVLVDIILAENERIQVLEAHVSELMTICEKLSGRVVQLEAQAAKNSSNSSKPPSMDGFNKPKPKSLRKKSGKKRGGQFGHKGETLKMIESPNEVVVHPLDLCPCGCGSSLEDEPVLDYKKRQVFEMPKPTLTVIEHRVEVKRCPRSGKMVAASFPGDVNARAQYGPGFTAFLVYLRNVQLVPLKRISQMCFDLFDYSVSEATIVLATERAGESLQGFEQSVKQSLGKAVVLHADETGLRARGDLNWLHVLSNGHLTWYGVHAKRGRTALEHFDILPRFTGHLIHDCWSPYFSFDCSHGLCNAHILRELKFCHEELKQRWAKRMERHLCDTHRLVEYEKQAGVSGLSALRRKRIERDYDAILSQGRLEQPATSFVPPKRGRRKKSKAANLLDRLDKYRDFVLAFTTDFRAPFTNNQAEQDVRMMKVQQKISGGFRTFEGAQKFALVRSYISTARKHGLDILPAITDALCGRPFIPAMTPE